MNIFVVVVVAIAVAVNLRAICNVVFLNAAELILHISCPLKDEASRK